MRTKVEIIDYFQEFIYGSICHNIENCIKAGSNYVVALALLSYTEYIGRLISGNLGIQRESGKSFKKALDYFPNEYNKVDSSIVIQYIDKDGQPILDKKGNPEQDKGIYGLFRCGMVHEYFIKGLGAVINNPDGHAEAHLIGVEVMNVEISSTGIEEKLLILRTNEYFRDFKSAIDRIFKLLVVDKDPRLLRGFNNSLDRIYSRRIL